GISDKFLFDNRLNEERGYWLKRLAGHTELPAVILEPAMPRAAGAVKDVVNITLAGEHYQKFRSLTGGSLFLTYTFLMAGLMVCLHRYTRSNVVTVGSPALKALGRANALTIIGKVKKDATFRELLVEVRET